MITENYVSFETAKLLKERGFDGQCLSKYNSNGWIWDNIHYDGMLLGNNDIFPNECLAPTLQMAMKWLREEKRCIIVPNPTWFTVDGCKKWSFSIWADDNLEVDGEDPDKRMEYDSYEEAVESAIKYVLQNLI